MSKYVDDVMYVTTRQRRQNSVPLGRDLMRIRSWRRKEKDEQEISGGSCYIGRALGSSVVIWHQKIWEQQRLHSMKKNSGRIASTQKRSSESGSRGTSCHMTSKSSSSLRSLCNNQSLWQPVRCTEDVKGTHSTKFRDNRLFDLFQIGQFSLTVSRTS